MVAIAWAKRAVRVSSRCATATPVALAGATTAGAATGNGSQPILMPDSTLFGWIESIAGGQAQLILNKETVALAAGYRAGPYP